MLVLDSPYMHPRQKGWSLTMYTVPSKKATLTCSKQYTHQLLFVYRNEVYISGDAYTSYLSPITSHASMHRLKSTQFPIILYLIHHVRQTNKACTAYTHTTRNKLFGLHTLSNKVIEFSIHTEEMGVLVNHYKAIHILLGGKLVTVKRQL